jgi:hypothetical protein
MISLVVSRLGIPGGGSSKCPFLDGHVGVEVDPDLGLDARMPEPQRDHRHVHTGAEELRRTGVALSQRTGAREQLTALR